MIMVAIFLYGRSEKVIIQKVLAKKIAWFTKIKLREVEVIDDKTILQSQVILEEGIDLPIAWGEIGRKMIDEGVIDLPAFDKLYANKTGWSEESTLLKENINQKIKITKKNESILLNIFWAFGLGNKNAILDNGPMTDPSYNGAGSFASTGGWTLAKGEAMNHYSKHEFVKLTADQQKLVEAISKNIYRPCCNNSTYFPDCNHGMAMLGLIELLAANDQNEEEIYRIALQVNSYWFPSQYLTIAQYFKEHDTNWSEVNPKEILGKKYSSSSGFSATARKIKSRPKSGGGSCGI